jgi:hypothetical protein
MNHLAGLGRLYAPDDRDRAFQVAPPSLASLQNAGRTFVSHLMPPVMDQASTSECVAYSFNSWLMGGRIRAAAYNHTWLYKRAQALDPWAHLRARGEVADGTSVRACAQALRALGDIESFRWAFDGETAARYILSDGPMILGVRWFERMFDTDEHGYVWPVGPNYGGHAVVVPVVNLRRQNPPHPVTGALTHGAVQFPNSWGGRWGGATASGQWTSRGRAWITLDDLDRLIKDRGEACSAVPRRA